MFDTVNNTWHCHCVKAKQSCVHKAIAKWHFFQTRKELFTGDESEVTQESQDSEDQVETVTSRDLQYPPRDEDLGRIVRYTQHKKRIPADLPAKVYGLTSETEVVKHLIPKECVCPDVLVIFPLVSPLSSVVQQKSLQSRASLRVGVKFKLELTVILPFPTCINHYMPQ